VPPAPLRPIPAVGGPFGPVLVDCVGPLPETEAGSRFLLTVVCVSTGFPGVVPLGRIAAAGIAKALIGFFTAFGLPRAVQTDQGTGFLSRDFGRTLQSLGVSHSVSGVYRPESRGALKRWHRALRPVLSGCCHDAGGDWDESVPFVWFAVRDAGQGSLGFDPAGLVWGHDVRGPLGVLGESFLSGCSPGTDLVRFVTMCKAWWQHATSLEKEALCVSQAKMKKRFHRKAVRRKFQPGTKSLCCYPSQALPSPPVFQSPFFHVFFVCFGI